MAITYITGIPRSGKSYYAMYLLYKQFIEPKKTPSKFDKLLSNLIPAKTISKSWDIAYTNINQFDFSKSDKIKPYVYNEIQAKLNILYGLKFPSPDKNGKIPPEADDAILKLNAKNLGIYNCLFVIDEAQNFFSSDNAVTTWWMTYHGHLHQDIILITQNLDLIEKSYFKLAEFYYKAVPPSSRFFSNKFRYIQYNSYKLFKGDRIGDFHVPMLPDIFKMYVSGASNDSKSVVKRYFLYFIILCCIVVALFFNFISMFNTKLPQDTNTTKPQKETNATSLPVSNAYDLSQNKVKPDPNTPKIERDTEDDELFVIDCFDMLCNYKGSNFPKPLFNKLTKTLSPDFIWFFQNASYTQYYVMLPKNTFDFLQIGEKENEKQNKKPNSPSALDVVTQHASR